MVMAYRARWALKKLSYSANELLEAAKDTITTGYTTRLIQEAARPQPLVRYRALQ